jgi:hypothetical protein
MITNDRTNCNNLTIEVQFFNVEGINCNEPHKEKMLMPNIIIYEYIKSTILQRSINLINVYQFDNGFLYLF